MELLKQMNRLIKIQFVLAKHGIDEVVLGADFFKPIRFLTYLNPFYWLRNRHLPRGVRVRQALEDLGPIFVKLGQQLSTRRDLFPEDIANELQLLQDNVPPFRSDIAIRIIEKAYGKKMVDVFETFDVTPLASASIAQVHAATLYNGQKIVIKVLRPNIKKIIRKDLSLMYSFARLMERFSSHGRRLRMVDIITEFDHHLSDELDFMHEAANASLLRRNFLNSSLLRVPQVYWDYTRSNVMMMERIYGVPISDIETLRSRHVNFQELAERGVTIFFTQVFRDCFFHADMHAGNIFVDCENPDKPVYVAVDFGIMGTLSPQDQGYLAANLHAFFDRDYRRVAQLHLASGWVPANTRVDEFESAIRTVCEPIFERPLKDISFGLFLLRLFQTARRFHMEVQPQLILLQKTLLNIEGLGRELYPELDLWKTAKPILEKWMKERIKPTVLLKRIYDQLPALSAQLPDYPELIYHGLKNMQHIDTFQRQHIESIEKLNQQLQKNTLRQDNVILGGLLIVSATIIANFSPTFSWILVGLGSTLLVFSR